MAYARAANQAKPVANAYGALDELELYFQKQEAQAEEIARQIELRVYLEQEELEKQRDARCAFAGTAEVIEGALGGEREDVAEKFAEEDAEGAAAAALALEEGKEAACAELATAERQFTGANRVEALRLARAAWESFDKLGDAASTALGEARAVKLIVGVHMAEGDLELALGLAAEQVAYFRRSGCRGAEAVAHAALADVHLAMDRCKEALRAAEAAHEAAQACQDRVLVAMAARSVACSKLRLGGPVYVAAALGQLEEAAGIYRQMEDAKEEAATLLLASKAHAARQEYEEAMKLAGSSGELARSVGYRNGEAEAWQQAAHVMLAQSQLEEALQAALEASKLCDAEGPLGEVSAQHLAACAYQLLERPQEASEALEAALSAARVLEDGGQISASVDALAQLHLSSGRAEKAVAAMREELQLARASEDFRRLLAAFQGLVGLQLSLEKPDDALRSAEEAVEVLGAKGDKWAAAMALRMVAEVHRGAKQYTKALAVAGAAMLHLKETECMRDLVAMLQLTSALYAEMGDGVQALRTRIMEWKAYKAAGWKDEEAAVKLSIAELKLPVEGTDEALKAAKEAVVLYDEMQDRSGKADALLMLARLQVFTGSVDEASGNLLSARRLFQAQGNAIGEAGALLVLATVYAEKGINEQAMRLMRDALAICRRAGQRVEEAKALEALANMLMALVQKEVDAGLLPPSTLIQDALDSTASLSELYAVLGDVPGEARALALHSSAHLRNGDAKAALRAAERSWALASELGDAEDAGSAKLALALARQHAGGEHEARQAAEEAACPFGLAADSSGLGEVSRLAAAPREVEEPLAVPGPAAGHARTAETEARHRQPTRSPHLPSGAVTAQPGARAAQPRARAAQAVAGQGALRGILRLVRPQWGLGDLQLMQEKLASIAIEGTQEFFCQLRAVGVEGMNSKLRAAGSEEIDAGVLHDFHELACRGMVEYEGVGPR